MIEGSVMDAAGSVGTLIGQGMGSVADIAVKGLTALAALSGGELKAARQPVSSFPLGPGRTAHGPQMLWTCIFTLRHR